MNSQSGNVLPEAKSPMQELLTQLPLLLLDDQGQIDFSGTAPSILIEIAENAETTAGVLNLGISAVGTLMAHAALPINDGSISSDAVEALGWLLSELGACAGFTLTLAARCRQARTSADGMPP
jgi:hypothetical protein